MAAEAVNAHSAINEATVLRLNSILKSKRLEQVKRQKMVGLVGGFFRYAGDISYVYLLVQAQKQKLGSTASRKGEMFLVFNRHGTRVPCVDLSEDGICFGIPHPIYLEPRPLFVHNYGMFFCFNGLLSKSFLRHCSWLTRMSASREISFID